MPDALWHWLGYSIAIASLVVVVWALFWDRARGRKRCRKCFYDMSGIADPSADAPATCPECGKAHTKPKHLLKTRRRLRWASVGLLAMVVGGYGLWVVPRVQDEGAWGLVPTTVLVLAAPWIEIESEVVASADGQLRRSDGHVSRFDRSAAADRDELIALVRAKHDARNGLSLKLARRAVAIASGTSSPDVITELVRRSERFSPGERSIASWWWEKAKPYGVQRDFSRWTESLAAYVNRKMHPTLLEQLLRTGGNLRESLEPGQR